MGFRGFRLSIGHHRHKAHQMGASSGQGPDPRPTVQQAIAELHRLQTRLVTTACPRLAGFRSLPTSPGVIERHCGGARCKSPATVGKEHQSWEGGASTWAACDSNQIKRVVVHAFIATAQITAKVRKRESCAPRCCSWRATSTVRKGPLRAQGELIGAYFFSFSAFFFSSSARSFASTAGDGS